MICISLVKGMDQKMKVRKNRGFLAILLFCMIMFAACETEDGVTVDMLESVQQPTGSGEEDTTDSDFFEEKLLLEQKELYVSHIETLEELLLKNREQEQTGEIYQELISSIYIFSEAYSGGTQASYTEDGITAFQMVIADDDTEKKQRYGCRPLADGSLWFTYQTESEAEKDLPDYVVNEDVLRYKRADYAYDDGREDVEEKKQLRRQEVEQYMTEGTGGEAREFWCDQDRIYQVNRKDEILIDVTEERESCVAEFLREQLKRINCQLAVSEDSLEEIERYKPEGYSLLWGKNAWKDIAVSDLNHDGRNDYVAVLYPDDHEKVQKYEGFSPYEKIPEYYAAGFWLFLSSEDGSYERISLSNSIEYWEDALTLVEVAFVDDGILQLEYFIGRSPFSNALLRFRYDEEKQDFYMFRSYYRDSCDDAILIGDVENYGSTVMRAYFAWLQHYNEGIWENVNGVSMQDGSYLKYYSSSFQYRCKNLVEEHHINSLIWEKEYELIRTVGRHNLSSEPDIYMVTENPVFYGGRLVCGQVELHGNKRILIPIMVDKLNGEYVTVTGLLKQEEFLQIFEDWSADALSQDEAAVKLRERCRTVIGSSWEKADSVETYFGRKDEILFLQIVQEGIRVGVWSETDERMRYFIIDKEYFWGTKVWDFLKG